MSMERDIAAYLETLARLGAEAAASDRDGGGLTLGEAFSRVLGAVRRAHDGGGKTMFIGNGGSAGIASHCAIDYCRNGNLRALAFNDGAALTCLGNDFGYEEVFARQIAIHARPGDVLIAISSSGRSPNILKAAAAAREAECAVTTLSGFQPDNPLRGMGDVNFYVNSERYGFVEILHLVLCHAMLDLAMGWQAPPRPPVPEAPPVSEASPRPEAPETNQIPTESMA